MLTLVEQSLIAWSSAVMSEATLQDCAAIDSKNNPSETPITEIAECSHIAASSSSVEPRPRRILDLPAEIRLTIWRYALNANNGIIRLYHGDPRRANLAIDLLSTWSVTLGH